MIVEVVDGDNRPVPPGADGEKLLVTVLWSRTLPLIRYELADRVRLAAAPEPCRLPFPLVAGIQGRTDDALALPSIARGMVSVHPHVFHSVLDIVPAAAWQVVRQDDHITVVLAGAAGELSDAVLLETRALCLAHGMLEQHMPRSRYGSLGSLLLVACGGTPATATSAASDGVPTVVVDGNDFSFTPAVLTAKQGQPLGMMGMLTVTD